jgi:hypothetical protein
MEELDGDVVEGGVGEVSGDVREVARGVAELAIGQHQVDFRFVLHGVDDVGGAERNIKIRHVVLVEKRGFVGGDAHTEDADVTIFEDEVMVGFLWEGNGGGGLGVKRECEQEQERTKKRLHLSRPPKNRSSQKKNGQIPG